jgi:hypothetical protein
MCELTWNTRLRSHRRAVPMQFWVFGLLLFLWFSRPPCQMKLFDFPSGARVSPRSKGKSMQSVTPADKQESPKKISACEFFGIGIREPISP